MKAVVVAIVLVILLAFGAYKVDTKPAVSSCGSVSGGSQWTSRGIEAVEGFGNWVHDLASKPSEDRRAAIEKAVDGVWRKVLLVWFKTLISSGRGKPLDPEVAKVKKQAEAERQAAEDRCTPCPTADPVPPVGGVDPRVMLTASQATGSESESIVRGAVKIADERGYGYNEKLAITEAGLVESGLRIIDYGHSSSIGWLQLIDTNGTYAQRMSIDYPANWFYDEMERLVPDHASTPPGEIAARVQRPRADLRGKYAEREADARKWLDKLGEAPGEELSDLVGEGCSVDPTEPGTDDGTYETEDFSGFQNPRTVAQAIEYMKAQGSTYGTAWPTGGCLHWVGAAYGYQGTTKVNGRHWAIDHWTAAPDQYKHPNDTTAPRGALLFWDTGSRRPGHIAISNGDGKVWSTDQPSRGEIGLVSFSTFKGYGKYMGWLDPYFIGQTKVSGAVAA